MNIVLSETYFFYQSIAQKLFEELGEKIKLELFVVEINKSTQKINSHPKLPNNVCGTYNNIINLCLEKVSKITKLPEDLYSDFLANNRGYNGGKQYDDELLIQAKNQLLVRYIQQGISKDETFKHYTSFCSELFQDDNSYYLIFVHLPSQFANKFYSLPKDIYYSPHYILPSSLLNSLMLNYLNECVRVIKENENKKVIEMYSKGAKDYIRLAGELLTKRISFSICNNIPNNFFDCINSISSLYYEKSGCKGMLLLVNNDNPNLELTIKFIEPIELNKYKTVRKLFEISSDNNMLVSDTQFVYGIGKLKKDYDKTDEKIYIIEVNKSNKWKLYHNNNLLMAVELGHPVFPQPKFKIELLDEKLIKKIGEISDEQKKNIYNVINAAILQTKGTIIVISKNALTESQRLKKYSINTEPFKLVPDIVHKITAIDGAVMMDINCICFSFGLILDGIANIDKGDNSRGARYNSAIKYLETNPDSIIIIVSEDGMVDVI